MAFLRCFCRVKAGGGHRHMVELASDESARIRSIFGGIYLQQVY